MAVIERVPRGITSASGNVISILNNRDPATLAAIAAVGTSAWTIGVLTMREDHIN